MSFDSGNDVSILFSECSDYAAFTLDSSTIPANNFSSAYGIVPSMEDACNAGIPPRTRPELMNEYLQQDADGPLYGMLPFGVYGAQSAPTAVPVSVYHTHITATGGFLPAAAPQAPFVPPPSPGGPSDPSNEQQFAGVGVPCRWGIRCGMLLTDVSHAGVQKHLTDNHVLPLCNPGEHRPRGTCEWYPEGGSKCGREMYQNQYGRHVATVHLECNRCKCERCGAKFTRIDGLARHSKTCRSS